MKYKELKFFNNFWKNYAFALKKYKDKDIKFFIIKENLHPDYEDIFINFFNYPNDKIKKLNENEILNFSEKELENIVIAVQLNVIKKNEIENYIDDDEEPIDSWAIKNGYF